MMLAVPACSISLTCTLLQYQQNLAPYDQYELIVPLTSAGTCLELVRTWHGLQA